MKWTIGQAEPLIKNTLLVIFQVPHPTHVERYLKRWIATRKTMLRAQIPVEKESFAYEIMKLNKEIQADWFQGTKFEAPEVPIAYHDKFKDSQK